jgi:RNase P subunit RPR2
MVIAMKKRLHNPNLAKLHRSYTVEETAELYGVFKGTVRAWIKAGLPILDDKRPMLILGKDLAAFHQERRMKNKRKCQPGEIYCVRCRAPKLPAGNMADYRIITEKIGNLQGICPDCDKIINQRVSLAKLEQISGKLDIALPQALQRITDSNQPSVNSDLKRSN